MAAPTTPALSPAPVGAAGLRDGCPPLHWLHQEKKKSYRTTRQTLREVPNIFVRAPDSLLHSEKPQSNSGRQRLCA